MAGYREFQTGEVLTAANVNNFLMNQSVMVFADSAARNTALGTAIAGGNALVEGMLTYNQDSGKLEIYNGTSWAGVSAVKKIAAFTASGTWTVPAGVTYAIAHCLGGGGGAGLNTGGSDGSDSTVAFTGVTVTGPGALRAIYTTPTPNVGVAGKANSGQTAVHGRADGDGFSASGNSQWIVGGATVTPAESITVTVGNGGTGIYAGGSGYVYIEYYE